MAAVQNLLEAASLFHPSAGQSFPSAVFRSAVVAALLALKTVGAVGMMITASRNGVEIDRGMMVMATTQRWEQFAGRVADAPDPRSLVQLIVQFAEEEDIPLGGMKSAEILLGRDTRPSREAFLEAAKKGISAIAGVVALDMGILTTAQLHWMVRSRNKGKKASEFDYFSQIANSFRCLIDLVPKEMLKNKVEGKLVVDGANGVGGRKLEELKQMLTGLEIEVRNVGRDGVLNEGVGADYVQKEKVVPSGFGPADVGIKCASLDGDADRLVYFRVLSPSSDTIDLVDGDKIFSLFAVFIKEQLRILNKKEDEDIASGLPARLGIVQTAYANGVSTEYLKQLGLEVVFTPPGVRYLHKKASEYDIGIYFEANGHGSILFSEDFVSRLEAKEKELASSCAGSEYHNAALRLLAVTQLISQAVGDALSGLLLVEAVLQYYGWSIQRWSELYQDLPSIQLKIQSGKMFIAGSSRVCILNRAPRKHRHFKIWCSVRQVSDTSLTLRKTLGGWFMIKFWVVLTVKFETTINRFLAAADEFMITFSDMDNANLLTTSDAEVVLPASPQMRLNKEGSLIEVTASENGIKMLAHTGGQRPLRVMVSRAFESSRSSSQQINSRPPILNTLSTASNVSGHLSANFDSSDRIPSAVPMGSMATINSRTVDIKPRILDDADKVKRWKMADIVESAHLKALCLPESEATKNKIVRLLYTNSGVAVLALASSATHKLWKWQRSERNPSGKSTASLAPQLWQPANGILMTNDTSDSNPPEEATACIALFKNDSYFISASGGKVSLFNMMTFKVIKTFMPPPPAATFLAFHPLDNNIIVIGMDDSTIHIYNVRISEIKTELKGHQEKITGLAFSLALNVLVSSGADAQLCVWSIDRWEKKKSRFIQAPAADATTLVGETRVQFHNDQKHVLVVHENQFSIYDSELECMQTWSPRDSLSAPISCAIYSCDGLLVYAGFCDGAVGVFDAQNLMLRCRIAPSSYLSSYVAGSVHPVAITAHPSEPNQIALGMSDGGVHVVEPSDQHGQLDIQPVITMTQLHEQSSTN